MDLLGFENLLLILIINRKSNFEKIKIIDTSIIIFFTLQGKY